MTRSRVCLLAITALLSTCSAFSADLHVDSVNGSDATGDGSALNPWLTVTRALQSAPVDGDHVWLAPGVHDQALGENSLLIWPTGVSLHGAGAASTRLVDLTISLETGDSVVRWVIEGLHMESTLRGIGLSVAAEGFERRGPTVRRNVFNGFSSAVSMHLRQWPFPVHRTTRLNIEENVFRENDIGIEIAADISDPDAQSEHEVDILNNTIVGNRIGVSLIAGSDLDPVYLDATLANNTIAFNVEDGIVSSVRWNGVLYTRHHNNIIAFNGGYGLRGVASDQFLRANLWWSNTLGDVQQGSPSPTSVSADPLFVDAPAGDYHLGNGSPCIDAGVNWNRPEFDFEGDRRPQDGDGDLGQGEACACTPS